MAKKSNLQGLILAAIVFVIISQVIHTVGAMLTMGYYTDPSLAGMWSTLMMPTPGPPPAEFFIYSIIIGFVVAVIFVKVYALIEKALPTKTIGGKGVFYGGLLFLVGTVPGFLSTFLTLNLPVLLILDWTVEGLLANVIGGFTIAKIMK